MKIKKGNITIEDLYKHFKDTQSIISDKNDMDDAMSVFDQYIQQENKKRKINIIFDCVIVIPFIIFICFFIIYGMFHAEHILTNIERAEMLLTTDSTQFSYLVENGEPVTYQKLMIKYITADSLYHNSQNNLYHLAYSAINAAPIILDQETWTCQPDSVWILAKQILIKDNVIKYLTRNKTPITYAELVHERDSIINAYDSVANRLFQIKKEYDIQIIDVDNGFRVYAPQLDSALMLLPYFRENLSQTDDENIWVVTHPTK